MHVENNRILGHRLCAHHLEQKMATDGMTTAAGVCGLQNSPPGAWETALFNRIEGCTKQALEDALYREKSLLQAWSYRGVPVVFPMEESDVFLSPLIAQKGEEPWIYTRGIAGALEYMQMQFDDLLLYVKKAVCYLDGHTIRSKEVLDRTLADIVQDDLPKNKQTLWQAPSMYGSPERQTVGDAIVSFLLRPCAFSSLVVFGEREGTSPTFTSYKNWTGNAPVKTEDADKRLMRKFLHCYGPTTLEHFMSWLGCTKKQAERIWNSVREEIMPVEVLGKTRYMLAEDCTSLLSCEVEEEKIILLGAHDPYLDLRDRELILENKAHQKVVWQYVSNPGVVLKGGRVIGFWKTKTQKERLDISVVLWETTTFGEEKMLKNLAEEYAVFRRSSLRKFTLGA